MGFKIRRETEVKLQFDGEEVKHFFDTRRFDSMLSKMNIEAAKAVKAKYSGSFNGEEFQRLVTDELAGGMLERLIDIYEKSIVRVEGYDFEEGIDKSEETGYIPNQHKLMAAMALMNQRNAEANTPKN